MKKIGQVMQELGFNKNAPDSVKEAFIKHLIRASTGVIVATPSEKEEVRKHPEKVVQLNSNILPEQLCFNFEDQLDEAPKSKKAVS